MMEQPTEEGKLSAELRDLGKNLVEVLRTAWDQPERKRLQQEIVNGLNEMGTTIREETDKFTQSPTGQRLKSDVSNVTQRVQTGELEARGRQELLNALQMANQQIQRAIDKLSERSTPDLNATRRTGEGAGTGSQNTESEASQGQSSGSEGMSADPYTGLGDSDKGTDRSSADQANEERTEIHPDDMTAPSSDTGHREIHPDDVES